MNIVCITCYEVMVPAREGAIDSPGTNRPLHKLPVQSQPGWSVQFDRLPKLLVKMELDSGIIGWGELYRNHNWAVVGEIASILLGKNIFALVLQQLPFAYCREYDGFECAIWDARAKAHGMRVVDLLGGPVRDTIKVGAWSSFRNHDEIGHFAKSYQHQGYDCIKFKCDLSDDVVGWCARIADVAPGMQVILDPNERWEYSHETRRRIDRLQEIGNLLCLEDPLPRWKLSEYHLLRNYGAPAIVLHVSLPYIAHGQRISDAVLAIQQQAVDGFNFNCGLANFQRLDHVASAAHLPSWHGSEIDLGILEAMYLHSAAAAESCIWPSDIFGRLIREHDLLKEPLLCKPPFMHLPKGPGLGIEPDELAIAHYQITRKVYSLK